MKLSIVIPTLNEAHHIERLIRYLGAQKDERLLEIIVVDGGSTDQTTLLAERAGARVIHSPKKGRAAQLNAGAAVVKGTVLYFVHADVLPPRIYLNAIQQAIENGSQLGGCRQKFDTTNLLLRINAWFTRFNILYFRGGDQTLFITTKFFQQLGGFNEEFVIMEEYELMRRAAKYHPFALLPCSTITSARKYAKNNWLRVQLANFRAMYQFNRGVDPKIIRTTYLQSLNW